MLLCRNAKCYKEKSYQICHCLKVKPSFHEKLFQKEKLNYCYEFMSGDFQVICGSMVRENGQLPVSTETPALIIIYIFIQVINTKVHSQFFLTFCIIHTLYLYLNHGVCIIHTHFVQIVRSLLKIQFHLWTFNQISYFL